MAIGSVKLIFKVNGIRGRNEWVEFERDGLWVGSQASHSCPSIFLLQNPEGSIWALQKKDAFRRLPSPLGRCVVVR
jgi:hypothetical protein